MAIERISADAAAARLADFSAIVDVRSESEFAEDHLPGAVNWPVLSDAERHLIGTEYQQVSPFSARKRGAALTARNIARHLEREGDALSRDWRPLVYCWRGGQRSGALALVLEQIGFRVAVLDGGHRAFRRLVLEQLETLPARLSFRVLCGSTGVGKSRLLGALAAQGEPVLDLEGLARHRGSVLGLPPGEAQPTQKAFDTALWRSLATADPARPMWVESESRSIGRLRLPLALVERVRAGGCVRIEMPVAARVALLLDEYRHYVEDADAFCERLAALRTLRGAAVVERWQTLARAGRFAEVVTELLVEHYDPVYERSMASHFPQLARAPTVVLPDAAPASVQEVATLLSRGLTPVGR